MQFKNKETLETYEGIVWSGENPLELLEFGEGRVKLLLGSKTAVTKFIPEYTPTNEVENIGLGKPNQPMSVRMIPGDGLIKDGEYVRHLSKFQKDFEIR